MRAWRALKASGAAVLRDGVYLLPARDGCRAALAGIADDVRENGGTAYLLKVDGEDDDGLPERFDRSPEFGELLADLAKISAHLTDETALAALKQARKLRRTFGQLAAIDFFPGEAQNQADAALQELENSVSRWLSPNEPHPVAGTIPRLTIADYRRRTWATRCRPWVDRLASAWLVCRFIDPDARILWLASPEDCPANALGFDFDGATFTHIGAKVTFETLLVSFGLDTPALQRIGALVHYLDVGGVQPVEASGIERVLAGLREALTDDDQLLTTAAGVFDGLFAAFEKDSTP
jgi:hypothetical protein